MKKMTLVLLCCSAFLYACDSSKDATNDTANEAINGTSEKAAGGFDGALESAKESASGAMDAAKEAATEALAEGKDLKATAVESTSAAVESAKESINGAVSAAKDMSSAVATKTTDMIASVGTDDNKQGESIYKSKCVACHNTGAAGAPKLDDKAAWAPRIAQGNAVLTQHAIEGYKGSTGYMPPKGGYMNLSDEEIAMAVQYMVSQSQ